MELKTAIEERRSIRGFDPKPVSREILQEVLRLASRAVSAVNAQPWEFHVMTGDVLETVRQECAECFRNGEPPEATAYASLSGIYHTRRVEIAKQLLTAMEIPREDRARRDWWLERGFRYFDAPAAIVLCMDDSLDEATYRFDMGCVTQNICLAAMEWGLGTCVAYQGVSYQKVLRKHLDIADNKKIVCSISIGYPDEGFPANQVRSTREELERTSVWYGFADK